MKFLHAVVCLLTCSITVHATNTNQQIAQKKINYMKEDLQSLQEAAGGSLDDLLAKANRIAQMNDKCGSISLTEVLDESCQTFYTVELPQFEKEVAKATGEIRMGALQLENTLKNRVKKINACTDALQSFFLPYADIMDLQGDIVDIVPTNEAGTSFKVSYDFTMEYKRESLSKLENMAKEWMKQCTEVVINKSNGQFIEMFTAKLKSINDRHKGTGVNAFVLPEFYETGNSKASTINFFLKKRNFGAYYMNGRKLFDATPDDKKMVYFQMQLTTIMGGSVSFTKEWTHVKDNRLRCNLCKYIPYMTFSDKRFKGTENFSSETEDIKSGWIWN